MPITPSDAAQRAYAMPTIFGPITLRQVHAAASAMMLHMFAPHELPLNDELKAKYLKVAEAALQAAECVRKQEAGESR